MQITLEIPFRRFLKESQCLALSFEHALYDYEKKMNICQAKLMGDMAIIRLHDSWARFCRDLIFFSAMRTPLTKSGKRLCVSPKVKELGYNEAFKRVHKHGWNWANAEKTAFLAKHLDIANHRDVMAALQSFESPEAEIRAARNFCAHRSKNTAIRVREIWHDKFKINVRSINCFILAGGLSSGQNRYDIWVDKLRLISEAAIN